MLDNTMPWHFLKASVNSCLSNLCSNSWNLGLVMVVVFFLKVSEHKMQFLKITQCFPCVLQAIKVSFMTFKLREPLPVDHVGHQQNMCPAVSWHWRVLKWRDGRLSRLIFPVEDGGWLSLTLSREIMTKAALWDCQLTTCSVLPWHHDLQWRPGRLTKSLDWLMGRFRV